MRRLLITSAVVMSLIASCSTGATDVDVARPFALDQVMVDLFGTDDLDRYRWQIERDAEQALVDCMAAAGFDFYIDQPLPPGPTLAELRSPEFARENGFGIVSGFRSWITELDIDEQNRDRNGAFLRTLTGDEIERYFITLDGEPPEPGQLPDSNSCRARAGIDSYAEWERFLDILPNYTAIGEERDTHPDWVAARDEWRSCMAERGLDYVEPDAIRSDVTRRMNEAVIEAYPNGALPLVREGDGWTIDPAVEPLLAELEVFELGAATADLECSQPLQSKFDAVEAEVQQAFVDRNRVSVDELLAG